MKKQDVVTIIDALAPIKVSKVEKDLRGKILKLNFELQKTGKEIEAFVDQSRKSLFAELQEDLEKVSALRESAKTDRVKILQAEMQIKKEYPKVAEQEAVLNKTYRELLQEEVEIASELFSQEEIVSMFADSEIDLTLNDLNLLTELLTNKN